MLELKPGVRVTAMSPQIALAIQVAVGAWQDYWLKHQEQHFWDGKYGPLVVTSINDGTHSRTSLHHVGHACDIRTKTLPSATAKRWFAAEVRRRLGVDYDVILEKLGQPQEHVHIEMQPKSR